MVDYFQPLQRRDSARLPYDIEPSYPTSALPSSVRSRRSSVSSFAESETSVFSDVSITSSQTSASTHLSSGWESSTPYDSDDENYSSLYEDSSECESHGAFNGTNRTYSGQLKKEHASNLGAIPANHGSKAATVSNSQKLDAHQPPTNPTQGLQVCPSNTKSLPHSQCPPPALSHPRRTAVDASWSKPTLVTQHERRVNFVENLVDSATQLVALIWPMAMTEICNPGRQAGTPVITLRFFIRETLRRSRTSFSTLQVAMYYLALLHYGGQIPKCDRTPNQALHCGRRMFLASLILASKYLQDRNYFTKAWSRISNLSVAEINRNEMALLSALEYKLHIRPADFQKWTDGISKCTGAVQRGLECPWVEVLMAQQIWRPAGSSTQFSAGVTGMQSIPQNSAAAQGACARVPEHRLELSRCGQSVYPTKPFPLSVRPCTAGKPNLQWQGMAAHLQSRPAAAPTNLAQGVSQIFLQEQESLNVGGSESQSSLLSPPKTPEPEEMTEMSAGDVGSQSPPPAPKEPLLSLNTTPDSNDGISTFGNYLGPPSEPSPNGSDSDNAQTVPTSQSSVARFKADTLHTREEGLGGARSVGSSVSGHSPYVDVVSSRSLPIDQDSQRSIAAAVRAEFDSDTYMDVVPDKKPSCVNTGVQEHTRLLLNSKTSAGDNRASKHEKCQRRKRPAGSFSSDHGLGLRTKKILRS